MCVEPELQPISNPDDFPLPLSTLRSEHVWILQKMGFGVAGQKGAFVDVRVFIPLPIAPHLSHPH